MTMIFQKTIRNILFLSDKCNFVRKRCTFRFSSVHTRLKRNRNYARFTNVFIVSTAVFGYTVYISNKKQALCEIVDEIDVKELNIKRDQVYDQAICKSRDLLQRVKDESGIPGLVIGVSINGKTVWSEGLGYADIENRVFCSADTVMRIASISKSITMTAVAKLWEQGKLDLDKPVQDYVPHFPSKTFDGKPVTITCRQLVSHVGGIRHYSKVINSSSKEKGDSKVSDDKSKKNEKSEFDAKEYYIKEHYKDTKTSLNIFKDDPLIANPGSKFVYSTHGWTLISAIVEAASKEEFPVHMTKLFKSLGMHSTYLDLNDVLIYHRSRNYIKDKNGRLINAPYVDNSYKWAGGGFLSTVGDLLQFGNAMLYSLQFKSGGPSTSKENELNIETGEQNPSSVSDAKATLSNGQILPGYLNSKTVEALWTPVIDAEKGKYGMGWFVFPEVKECQFCENTKLSVFHTGGAVGASSVLLILPHSASKQNDLDQGLPPRGVVVTILVNLQSIPLQKTALKIAEIFHNESEHFDDNNSYIF